jgi:hypothetical protein
MGRLAPRIAENTGPSLGASGVFVAAALGLTQAGGGWLALGVALAIAAVFWAGFTLWAATTQSMRSEAFRQALARAHRDGEAILQSDPDDARSEAWVDKVHDLIAAGLGDAEAELFLSNHDIHVGMKVTIELRVEPPAETQMRLRLQRLSRLLDRVHSMPARIDFDPEQWVQ